MFNAITNLFTEIVLSFAVLYIEVFSGVFAGEMITTFYTPVNIYLFSDTGWFGEPIPLIYIINMVMFFWFFFFLLRLLWKGTKKFINMIFGVFRL